MEPPLRYYPSVAGRRVRHYLERRLRGYPDPEPLETAAARILRTAAEGGFRAGSHFPGVWPRDLCFGARGLVAAGFDAELRTTAEELLAAIDDTFYTDFHREGALATPAEGVDTFPALVCLLDETDALETHTETVARLADLHRRKFLDEATGIVSSAGSSWWDSAARPREGYDTAMLLAAVRRLERRGVETTYTGRGDEIHEALLETLWNGRYVDERRGSSALACDANVVPLYFGLFGEERAASVVDSLADLETAAGLAMRETPFDRSAVRPEFLFHRDYHYHVWPWNSFAYACGLRRYGYADRARSEVRRIERRLERYGTFLEVLALDGGPYVKRGYASAAEFTAAAALWTEFRDLTDDQLPPT